MLYESLRKLIVEAASPNAEHIFKGLDLTFSVQVTADEGDGNQVELIKGGKNVAVTSSNVHEYVRLYAEHRMAGNNKRALQVSSLYHLLVISHVHLSQDWVGTPTWPPFHCLRTPIWQPQRNVETLCVRKFYQKSITDIKKKTTFR